MNNCNNEISKKPRLAVIVSVVTAVVLLLNVALNFLPDSARRFDVTTSNSYTLSATTKEYFSSLGEKINIYVLDADGSDVKFEYMLKRMDGCSDNVNVRWTNFEKVADKLTALGVKLEQASPYLIIIESSKRSIVAGYSELITYRTDNTSITSYIGTNEMTAVQYENLKTAFAQQASTSSEYASQYMQMLEILIYDVEKYFNAEPYICQMIEYVTVDIIPARYALTGHGEAELSKTEMGYYLSDMVGLNYGPLDISDGGEIPADAVSIMVIDPTSDITKAEANKLISYLDRGGQITFFTSDEDLDLPNLMSVINAYGLSADNGIVGEMVEIKGEESEGEGEGDTVTEILYVTDVSVKPNTAHKSMEFTVGKNITPVISKGNSITYENKSGFTLTPILTTSANAYVGENKDDMAVRSLAAISEKKGGGTLLWFTGAGSFTVPILGKDEANDPTISTTVYSNIYIVISSLVLAPFSYESTVKLPDAKFYGERLMSVTETSYVVYAVVIAVLVIIFAVFGVIYWYKRKKA